MELLEKLPTSIATGILSQWLTAKSWGQLDAACCNRKSRISFLELLASTEAVEFETTYFSDDYFSRMHWINERKVKGTELEYGAFGSPSQNEVQTLRAYIQYSAQSLKSVTIYCNDVNVTGTLLSLVALSKCCLLQLHVLTPWASLRGGAAWAEPIRNVINNSAMTLADLNVHSAVVGWFHIIGGAQLPALLKIHISECSDSDLATICSAAPKLQYIDLKRPRCTHRGFEAIASHCFALLRSTILAVLRWSRQWFQFRSRHCCSGCRMPPSIPPEH